MISMTGYGFAEVTTQKISLTIEIKSYNNRYLDIFVNMPLFLNMLEPRIREEAGSYVSRGKVEIYIRVKEFEEDLAVHLDSGAVAEYSRVFTELAKAANVKNEPSIADFLQLEGVLKTEKRREPEAYFEILKPVFSQAMELFIESRKKEGSATRSHILSLLDKLDSEHRLVCQRAPIASEQTKKKINEGFAEAAGNQVDESRMLQELAAYLVRYSVEEEISRLSAHLSDFRKQIDTEGPVGKRLDFLCQEINRETNTIGSKTVDLETTRAVVRMKDSLENIREQLRNVE
jgi:uncharacterized protein (TIGR00255 family)